MSTMPLLQIKVPVKATGSFQEMQKSIMGLTMSNCMLLFIVAVVESDCGSYLLCYECNMERQGLSSYFLFKAFCIGDSKELFKH